MATKPSTPANGCVICGRAGSQVSRELWSCATCDGNPTYCRFHMDQSHSYHPVTRDHKYKPLVAGAAPIEAKSFFVAGDATPSAGVNGPTTATASSSAPVAAVATPAAQKKEKEANGKKEGGNAKKEGGKKETNGKAKDATAAAPAAAAASSAPVVPKEEKKRKPHPAWHGPNVPDGLPPAFAKNNIPRILNSLTSKQESFLPASGSNQSNDHRYIIYHTR